MSGAVEEETVDWGDVETTTVDAVAEGGDDVISLGGAEDLEEEVSPPKAIVETSIEKIEDKAATPAAIVEEPPVRVLPSGWKLQQARSGGEYYFNTVTGKTTWEFPSEEADTKAVETAPSSTTAGEKLAGIQIKGAARAAPSSEDDTLATCKKRDAESQSKEAVVAEEIPQKRRRSNTPEKKRKIWSASPEPAKRPAEPTRNRDDRDDRVRDQKTREDSQTTTRGWGRRPEIANESNAQDARSRRYDNEPRETGYSSRQNSQVVAGRDRNYERGQNGGPPAPPTGRFVRPDTYQPDRSRPSYDDRRPSARDATDRSNGRQRETSPVPRRREEYDRGGEREARREPRDRDRDRDREPERRDMPRDQHREAEKDRPRSYTDRDVRGDRGRDRNAEEDRRSVKGSEPPRSTRPVEANLQNQGYGSQGYNYMDRGSGPRPPRMLEGPASALTGYGPPRGYGPRSNRPDSAAGGPPSPVTPFSPSGQGYGSRGMPPQPPGGARPVRPWIAPEEKAKKWWNKNTGERKPVNPDAAAEAEADEGGRHSRRSSSKPSVEPTPVYRTDRERELAEREAAIARKERELGFK